MSFMFQHGPEWQKYETLQALLRPLILEADIEEGNPGKLLQGYIYG